ncbi:uncharacterized protein A4U43_C09F9460 [Asparagus officinalis]|uniref:Uncharacterized protein n=1 Tax=Asparagus officinalis TaxID=4686 RepID=A0A5P1E6D6_ASPOF|nr:uncharacterized protein A4U43_C09F9460 [Asparagus officinalis]
MIVISVKGLIRFENVEIGEQRRKDNAYDAAATRGSLYEEAFDGQVEDEGVTLEGAEQKLEAKAEEGDDDVVFGEDYDDVEKYLDEARKLTLKRGKRKMHLPVLRQLPSWPQQRRSKRILRDE